MERVAARTAWANRSSPVTGRYSTPELEPPCGRTHSGLNRAGHDRRDGHQRVAEHREELVVHLAQEAQGDVPMAGIDQPEVGSGRHGQTLDAPPGAHVGPYGHEHPHGCQSGSPSRWLWPGRMVRIQYDADRNGLAVTRALPSQHQALPDTTELDTSRQHHSTQRHLETTPLDTTPLDTLRVMAEKESTMPELDRIGGR